MKMVLLIIYVIVFSYPLQSQIIGDYGVKIAMTFSDFDIINKHPGDGYLTGISINPSIGLFARLPIIESLVIETELLYLQKGSRESLLYKVTTTEKPEGTGETLNYTMEIGVYYIQLDINLQPKIKFENFDTYGIVGPTLGYLAKVTNFAIKESKRKDFAFGYSIGIGVNLRKIVNDSFLIELKYNGDFYEYYSSGNGDYWNRVFILTLGTTI